MKPYLSLETSALIMGIVRLVFRQLISRFSIFGMQDMATGGNDLNVDSRQTIGGGTRTMRVYAEGYEMWLLPCIRLKTSQSNCLGVTA